MTAGHKVLWAGLLLATGLSQATAASNWMFVGKAYNADDRSTLLYEEHHRVEGECGRDGWHPIRHQIDYRTPGSGEVFAHKTLDYQRSDLMPSVEFEQPMFDERMTITNLDNSQLSIEWLSNGKDLKQFRVNVDDNVVADAGFDNLVREHWSGLRKGRDIDFRFLAPTRGEHYGFTLASVDDPRIRSDVALEIRPSGVIMGLLVDPILLGYNAEGYLTDYIGLTNIRKNQDANYIAHIRYHHGQPPTCALVPDIDQP
ncbi:hypothetical protein [Marinobacter caseinilyticus]|uniref:hypothetical protein n=1 Tax=Marinobacter caseinilyticus TaxID=2692195 RepID=UPI00140833BD|nr:hypothetical protein [Marinobacter caseinilyticus]